MAKFRLAANAELDLLTRDEVKGLLDDWDKQQIARLRAISTYRLPVLNGKAAAGVLSIGGDAAQVIHAPESGYAWSVRHLVIEGLTTGATPDVVNILRNNRIIWQLNGNQFAQTWGRGEITLKGGESLQYLSVGSFAATGSILVHGLAEQVPEEMIGKFYA